jgi:hypothetical protein
MSIDTQLAVRTIALGKSFGPARATRRAGQNRPGFT